MIRGRDIAGAMQLMHADGVMRGGRYIWANYFDPEPELLAKFESISHDDFFTWETIEPEYAL